MRPRACSAVQCSEARCGVMRSESSECDDGASGLGLGLGLGLVLGLVLGLGLGLGLDLGLGLGLGLDLGLGLGLMCSVMWCGVWCNPSMQTDTTCKLISDVERCQKRVFRVCLQSQ